ncbi:MAG: polysaccharide biosynthesis protein PslG [Thermoleophilaceae bacterium]|jgi:hypothetical protein|nr:polysaccharide biosynthesis protein PslG [Thermoleophilaceae bacterium]
MARVTAIAALATALALVGVPQASAAKPRVPKGFVGMVADGPLLDPGRVNLQSELDAMVGQGVESLRVVVDWSSAQPYRTEADVPPAMRARFSHDEGGVPTDYSLTDRVMEGAVRRHMTLLPVILIAPGWAARHQNDFASPPKDPADYARFVGAMARRYGPHGSFWAEHPELPAEPVRKWQFWNEPSLRYFWSDRPWEHGYVDLLRAAHHAVKAVDPHSTVVLAGLPNRSWPDLRSIYELGARKLFDIVAIHPFTGRVKGVLTILDNVRRVMRNHGDAKKPLMVTELSWTTAVHKTEWTYGNETTEVGQGKKLTAAMALLVNARKRLHLLRVYWYTWLSFDRDKLYPFDYAGLSRLGSSGKIVRKPGYKALRRTALELEGCKSKSGVADRCAS